MTKSCLFLMFLLMTISVLGQTKIHPGEQFKVPFRQVHQAFLSEDEFGLHGVSIQRQGVGGQTKLLIIDYDTSTLLPLRTSDITPEKIKGLERNVTQIFTLRKGFVVAVEETSEQNVHELCLIHFNAQKEPTQSFHLPITPNINKTWPYDLVVDPKETGFMLAHYPKARPGTNQQLEVVCFDGLMNQEWVDTLDFPQERGGLRFQNFTTDGSSTLFFNYRAERPPESQVDDPRMNIVHFAGYNRATQRVNELEIQLNKRTILNYNLKSVNNNCQMIGWFTKERPTDVDGYFALVVDEQMNVEQQVVHDFTKEEVATLFPQSGYESTDSRKSVVRILSVETLDSNRQLIIGERQKQVIAESGNGGNNSAFTEVFYFQDVALIELDSNLNFVAGYQLEKGQVSANDQGEYSSLAWFNFENGISFYYNDNPRNKRRRRKNKMLKSTSTAQRAKLSGVTLAKNLMIQQNVIHKGWLSKKIKLKGQDQLLSDALYFYARKGFKAQLLKVNRH